MLETLLIVVVTGVAGLAAFLVVYARWHYGSLEKLGIPVAKPHFLLGSDPDGHKIVYQDRDIERYKKYGPLFGVYEGRVPRVFIIDPNMIRHVMVKDFEHFYDRTSPDVGIPLFDSLLDFLQGETWKTVRSALTPMFTSSRIRDGGKRYMEVVDRHLAELKKKVSGDKMKLDMKDFMAPIFVEFTADYFLSIKISGEGDIKQNYIYKMVVESIFDDLEADFTMTLFAVFPFVQKLFTTWAKASDAVKRFLVTLEEVLKVRKQSRKDTSSGKDFIDVMMSMMEQLDSSEYKRLGIDKTTIQAQAFEMFVAGYDSIVTTLSILPYYLATNPEVQEKVLQEIDERIHGSSKTSDDPLADLPYLTACVREAIRLSPSFHRLERVCSKDWTYNENGLSITIPKGMSVLIPAWATNRNPEVFENPEEFRPERFLKVEAGGTDELAKSNVAQFSMCSFGHGPRNCPGSRMGHELVKAGMYKILREYKFAARPDTEAQIKGGIPFLTRYHPIYLDIVKRSAPSEQ